MNDNTEDLGEDADDFIPPSASDGFSEEELNTMHAQFNVLFPQLMTACQDSLPRVSIATLMSVAGSISVQVCESKEDAARYLAACFRDILTQMPDAFEEKERRKSAN